MTSAPTVRVLAVDDHDVVHWGLRTVLSAQPWVGRYLKAQDRKEALELARRYDPHVAIVDLFVGDDSGTEIAAELTRNSAKLKVLLISGSGRMSAATAKAAGAAGFITKDFTAHELANAVREICRGGQVFTAMSEQILAGLSQREREVLELMASGATNREIGRKLYLSEHTVKDYTCALYRKMQVRNRAHAIRRAQSFGLIA